MFSDDVVIVVENTSDEDNKRVKSIGVVEGNSLSDYMSFATGQYLTDNIIEPYLGHFQQHKLSSAQREIAHIFNVYFYTSLTTPPRGYKGIENEESARHAHKRGENWPRGVNIFDKEFIVVPINQSLHWFFAVMCFPAKNGVARTYSDDGKETIKQLSAR